MRGCVVWRRYVAVACGVCVGCKRSAYVRIWKKCQLGKSQNNECTSNSKSQIMNTAKMDSTTTKSPPYCWCRHIERYMWAHEPRISTIGTIHHLYNTKTCHTKKKQSTQGENQFDIDIPKRLHRWRYLSVEVNEREDYRSLEVSTSCRLPYGTTQIFGLLKIM